MQRNYCIISRYQEKQDDDDSYSVAVMAETKKGVVLKLNGYSYKKAIQCKSGFRWTCMCEVCPAFLILKDNDEIVVTNEEHDHPPRKRSKPVAVSQQSDVKREDDDDEEEVAVILNDGTLKFNGYKYRKSSKSSKLGTRWSCCVKACGAYLVVSEDDDIVSAEENHNHGSRLNVKDRMKVPAGRPKGVLVTSRHGNKNLLYRGFYYRRKYSSKGGKIRWVCSSLKNCRACVITSDELEVIKIFQEHAHSPPAIPILSQRGRMLLLYQRYTYSRFTKPLKNGWRWYCSRVKNCRAYLFTDKMYQVVNCTGTHIHSPMTKDMFDLAVSMTTAFREDV